MTRPPKPDVTLALIVCVGEDCVGARSPWVRITWLWDAEANAWTWDWAEPLPDGWEDIVDGEDGDDSIYPDTGEVDGYCPTCMVAISGIEHRARRDQIVSLAAVAHALTLMNQLLLKDPGLRYGRHNLKVDWKMQLVRRSRRDPADIRTAKRFVYGWMCDGVKQPTKGGGSRA